MLEADLILRYVLSAVTAGVVFLLIILSDIIDGFGTCDAAEDEG